MKKAMPRSKIIATALFGLFAIYFVYTSVLSLHHHAASRAEVFFSAEECELGLMSTDSEAYLKEATPSMIAAAKEDWGTFNVHAKVIHQPGGRYLLVEGTYIWPYRIIEPITPPCKSSKTPPKS